MVKKVSSAKAKAQFSALAADVGHGGQQVIIERRGKPLAALVSVQDLELLGQYQAHSGRPLGALALAGAWKEVEDSELEEVMRDIYIEREKGKGRPVEIRA